MKTPSFWYRQDGSSPPLIERLLAPLSACYALGHRIHQILGRPEKAPVPVICIGNLNTGGTGKTMVVDALVSLVKRYGLARTPFVLMRGYGGQEKGPLVVDTTRHTCSDVGDEALLLAQKTHVIVSANRSNGAQLAAQKGADLIIMDDGLHNTSIYKDVSLVVINGDMGFGNRKLLPAGPLRTLPRRNALKKINAVLFIGMDRRDLIATDLQNIRILHADTVSEFSPPADTRFVAFTGLGYPDKFFSHLENALGLDVVKTIPFPDHHPYSQKDINHLHQIARDLKASLITTEKDAIRLSTEQKQGLYVAPASLSIRDEDALASLLRDALQKDSSGRDTPP